MTSSSHAGRERAWGLITFEVCRAKEIESRQPVLKAVHRGSHTRANQGYCVTYYR